MYAYLKGKLVAKEASALILEVGPVGYELICEPALLSAWPEIGSQIKVYTYLNVREDAMELYAFPTEESKQLFLQLIKVSGIGAKLASTIIADIEPAKLILAIINNDLNQLTKIKGIGKKTAQRIVLELKDKLAKEADFAAEGDLDMALDFEPASGIREEPSSALRHLG